jgi:hypothetical protein
MWEECGPWPVFESFALAFALQLRKKHEKTSVMVRKTSVRVHITKTSTYLLTPWSRVLLEKLTSKLCS